MNTAVKREPCPGCGRPRLECWELPCPQLMEFVRDIQSPVTFQLIRQWCLRGGFDLYQDRRGNRYVRPRFAVGDGAHYWFNGDSYPVTVIDVSRGESRVTVRKDRSVHGLFLIDPNGKEMLFTRRKDGSYRSARDGTWILDLGRRAERNRER